MAEGVLKVAVVNVTKLPSSLGFGDHSVYAEVKCGTTSARCKGQKVVQQVAFFEEELTFTTNSEEEIEVQLYEQGAQGSRLLGSCRVALWQVITEGAHKVEVPLRSPNGMSMGEVDLMMRFTLGSRNPAGTGVAFGKGSSPLHLSPNNPFAQAAPMPPAGTVVGSSYPGQPAMSYPGWGALPDFPSQQQPALYGGSNMPLPQTGPYGYPPPSGVPSPYNTPSPVYAGASAGAPSGYSAKNVSEKPPEGYPVSSKPYNSPTPGYTGSQPSGYYGAGPSGYGYPPSGPSPSGYPQQPPYASAGYGSAPGGMQVVSNAPHKKKKKSSGPGLLTGLAAGALGVLALDAIF